MFLNIFHSGDSMGLIEVALTSTVGGSLATGLIAWLQRKQDRKKFDAEVELLKEQVAAVAAQNDRVEAETADLTSSRLIRELDRLAASNDQLSSTVGLQRDEIDSLRTQVLEYARREIEHAAENKSLRLRIQELERDSAVETGRVLRDAFPVQIGHIPNEFDSEIDRLDGTGI